MLSYGNKVHRMDRSDLARILHLFTGYIEVSLVYYFFLEHPQFSLSQLIGTGTSGCFKSSHK
jgi:hypothetical protein